MAVRKNSETQSSDHNDMEIDTSISDSIDSCAGQETEAETPIVLDDYS